ncbi:albumin-like isoform X2 [Dendrobates tinctorius]|uniref:albumin-like isoform X2 n=1 Tax=Dendrobates tinctorius TaxID=92724 RepID=UPI003CCA470A
MKWVTLICVLLCTIATESKHLQKRDTDHHPRNIGNMYATLGQDNFKHILLVITAQNFQKCTLEQHWKLVQELSAIAEHCVDHKDEADCKKPMNTIFYDKVCTGSDENKSYPWKADCCGKQDPERQKCFHDHRDTNIEPFKKPDAGAACKLQTENPHEAYHYYIDTIAKRHPSLFPLAIPELGKQYSMIMHDCCAEEEKEKCFDARMEYMQHVCDNHEKISPNLKACCEKSILERTPCMMTLPNEYVLADLPKEMKEFVEAEDVCKHYAEEKDLYLAKFLFEFTRRHPELSDSSCMRVAKGYEALLTKCCAEEHPADCYKAAPQLFEARIKEIQALAKQNCDAYEHHGPHAYNAELLGRYVPKMPQVSDETLLRITGKMTKFAGKCCALPENQRLSCADDKLDILLGDMCERETFINDQVHHCCVDSYADRRPCFTKLGRDPSYKAPEFDVNHYKVGADVCEGTEEEQKQKRLGMLIRVLKDKPDTPPEKRMQIIGKFNEIREKCCAEENHQSCFNSERPAFLLYLKNLLSH